MNGEFVAYYRVSTQKQGQSGLGLEAQKTAVHQFLNGGRWKLLHELVEVESGKNADRPKLAEALRLCRLHRAKLLVAKLDRLSRSVSFISTMMESGIKFQAVDMPDVNEMVLHILASVAQGEAKAISDRTKAALAAAKARGVALGGLKWNLPSVSHLGVKESVRVRKENASKYRADILPIIRQKQAEGIITLKALADALNADGTPAPRGGQWQPTQVMRLLKS
jgi:DNA invertase Pin-like site-specific DNA recombinase